MFFPSVPVKSIANDWASLHSSICLFLSVSVLVLGAAAASRGPGQRGEEGQ